MMDWMIGTGVAVTVLIVLVLIIRRPFARMFGAKAAYALWLLPFIRLVMPEVTIPRIFPQLSKAPSPAAVSPTDIVVTPEMLAALQAEPNLMSHLTPYLMPSLFGLWALGAVTFFLYHWTRQASLMDRLNYESEPALSLQGEINSAAQKTGLKRVPQVRISDKNAGPLVAKFFRPVIILPDNFMTNFSPVQRHYALMHEFMHIKRGDIWVALAWLVFRAVNWPNPLVHYAAKHFRSDQEAACDASVLGALEDKMGDSNDTVTDYAETLIHAAKAAMIPDTKTGRASLQPSVLALTIHHPLKERLMILGTHKKISNWRSRTAAAVMIIGAATLSAPLIQADAHPEEELAGKHTMHQGKSVIKRKYQYEKNGKTVSEHFEITVDGDDIEAYKIDPSGKKIRIDVEDIEGISTENLLSEIIEGGNSHSITISDGEGVKFMSKKDFKKWAETEYPEWKENDFASWVDGDFKTWVMKMNKGKLAFQNKDGVHSENVFVLRSDTLEGLEGLAGLKALEGLTGLEDLKGLKSLKTLKSLEGLERLEALKGLKNLDDFESYSFIIDDDSNVKLKMRLTESKLAAAMSLLEGTKVEEGDSREMAKAKRELEKARKALKAAERALKDAE